MRWTYDDLREKPGVFMWAAQTVVAGLFLFAGVFKLLMPAAALAQVTGLPGPFMHFVATCEVLGGLGLLLPGLLRIHEELTPLAACGLSVIMVGAVTLTVARMPVANAILPFINGLLCLFIAYRRRGLLSRLIGPARASARPAIRQSL
jgi:hypothetical protein